VIIKKIVLENYGLFSGRCEFDLAPRTKYGKVRPVILFGGKNGAGKTTLLDALRLLLYGRRSIGDRTSVREYEEVLLSKVHRNKNENSRAQFAKIGLSFEHVTAGTKHDYLVERSWMVKRGNKIEEFFKVERDGRPLDDISSVHWESFISDIVPERLSQLFFFDGEKIKNIAEDISSNAAISEAIQSLLGLDTVQALKSDLAIYRARLLKQANPDAYGQQMAENEAKVSAMQAELEGVVAEMAEVGTQIDGVICSIGNLDARLAERGGSFADKRSVNKRETEELHRRVHEREQAIRETCEGALQFVLCPKVTAHLIAQMRQEESTREKQSALQQVDAVGGFLRSAAKSPSIRSFLDEQLLSYRQTIGEGGSDQAIHWFSPREAIQIEQAVTTRLAEDVRKIRENLVSLEQDSRTLQEIEKDLDRAPEAEDLKELFETLARRNQELGSLHERNARLKERRARLEQQLLGLQRDAEKIALKIEVGKADSEKLDRLAKLGPAFELYREKLTRAKIAVLESEVTTCFNRLARKSDFVKAIRIDPNSFAVNVLDQQGRAVPKEELSSGEKQIFAIAMLWGLARTSGRPLPVVVDTPLGRLDSDHRANLIENYFPNAGHQVILLSTDTEVDQGLFRELSPAISHCYHLTYDSKQGHTVATEEYFWRDN